MAIIPDDLYKRLEAKYGNKDAWTAEQAVVEDAFRQIAQQLPNVYPELGDPLGVGGSGIVVALKDVNLGRQRALKISRPSPGARFCWRRY